jgi:hypothetical protein
VLSVAPSPENFGDKVAGKIVGRERSGTPLTGMKCNAQFASDNGLGNILTYRVGRPRRPVHCNGPFVEVTFVDQSHDHAILGGFYQVGVFLNGASVRPQVRHQVVSGRSLCSLPCRFAFGLPS